MNLQEKMVEILELGAELQLKIVKSDTSNNLLILNLPKFINSTSLIASMVRKVNRYNDRLQRERASNEE